MTLISVVIITKNEAYHIRDCIRSAKLISHDIIVVDCGSTDNTVRIAIKEGARVINVNWQCYGHSRNTGAAAARHEWVLALDADERISTGLAKLLLQLPLHAPCIYKIKRENFFGSKKLHYGTLGFERVSRLYHRQFTQWDLFPVHEQLTGRLKKKVLRQSILHFGIPAFADLVAKKEHYAILSAWKYLQQGKKPTLVKRFFAPAFDGIKSYVFQLGFLDGKKGWQIASTISYYTWLKYKYLEELYQQRHLSKEASPLGYPAFPASIRPFS